MKNSEIMARAMAEATGMPLECVRLLMLELLSTDLPLGHKLNDDIPEPEAARLQWESTVEK